MTKITRNQKRDQDVWRQLEAKGWSVIIVWECELEKNRLGETVSRVQQEILSNGELFARHQEERRVARLHRLNERREQKARQESLLNELKS